MWYNIPKLLSVGGLERGGTDGHAPGVLDGTFILQQIQTKTEHPKTVTEPTPETACIRSALPAADKLILS